MKVEVDLMKNCDGILALMDENLIPSASTGESMASHHKMKGDYYPILCRSDGETIAVVSQIVEEISEEIVEQTVGVSVSHIFDGSAGAVKLIPQEGTQRCTVEDMTEATRSADSGTDRRRASPAKYGRNCRCREK